MKIFSEEIHRAKASLVQRKLYTAGKLSILNADTTAYCAFFWELRDQNPDLAETMQIDILSTVAAQA